MHLSEVIHPNQLHGLSIDKLQQIACQIREKHLQTIAASGGHLGSGLGVVELTLALYQTLDLECDKVIWDVGHQAYPHKLITGRYNRFHTLRQKDGIAGYLKRCESKFDHFGAGHSSTSISAALGMALARDLKGEKFKVVAVIGDGALTGGMALEAINHAGHLPKTNLLVVLNDNEMSISPNVGALSRYLNKIRLNPSVQFLSDNLKEQVKQIPFVGTSLSPELGRLKEGMKRLAVSKVGAVFEELGFTYIGPVDGHNLEELIATFEQAHQILGPVLVHVATVKGKGYELAEKDQIGYHAQTPFNLTTGKAYPSSKPKPPTYTKVFAHTLTKLAEQDPKIIGITAAMATGTGLDKLQAKLPNQYIDVGYSSRYKAAPTPTGTETKMTIKPNMRLLVIAGRIPPLSGKREGVSVMKPGVKNLPNPSLQISKMRRARTNKPMSKPRRKTISKTLPIFSLLSILSVNSSVCC
ncbi:hypothetical protein NUACC21_07540 [Scytonema sp. NUACC21]